MEKKDKKYVHVRLLVPVETYDLYEREAERITNDLGLAVKANSLIKKQVLNGITNKQLEDNN